jgi:hypothetical protein
MNAHLLRLPRRWVPSAMHTLTFVDQNRRDHAMRRHSAFLSLFLALGFAETLEGTVRGDATVGVRDHDHVFTAFDEFRDCRPDQGFVGVHRLDYGVATDGREVQADAFIVVGGEDVDYLFEAGRGVPRAGDEDDGWFRHDGLRLQRRGDLLEIAQGERVTDNVVR